MDIYFKKELTYTFNGLKFIFETANTLFSTFDIDHGTDILIRSITPNKPKTILDIGCGVGCLGIILAKTNPRAEVIMIDRDLLAVRYTEHNIARNQIKNAKALASLGAEAVKDQTFDLIVSNVPAKIGDETIAEEFILKPYQILNARGEYWLVVVSALNRLIPKIGREYKLDIKEIRKRNGHTVYKITKP